MTEKSNQQYFSIESDSIKAGAPCRVAPENKPENDKIIAACEDEKVENPN